MHLASISRAALAGLLLVALCLPGVAADNVRALAALPGSPALEVLLHGNIERVRVRGEGPLTVGGADTGAVEVVVSRSGRSDLPFAVETASAKTLVAAPVRVAGPAGAPLEVRAVEAKTGRIVVEAAYRGVLDLRLWRGAAAVVNVIVPDDYVASVVASEIGAESPLEALKAQAVAARSFAWAEAQARRADPGAPPWDLVTSTADQVYRGVSEETPFTRLAALETAGEVLAAGGTVVRSVYHACSGGSTTSAMDAWHSLIPGPRPVFDGFGDSPALSAEPELRRFLLAPPTTVFGGAHPAFRWRASYTAEQLTRILARSLKAIEVAGARDIGSVQDVQVGPRSLDGRVTSLRIIGSKGETVVSGDAIRWAFGDGGVGSGGLRSTLFVLDKSGSEPPYTEYSFAGGGWGHGVGMSQAGAIDMARRGLSYRVILRHYYGDAELARLG